MEIKELFGFEGKNIERLQELLWSKSQNLEKWIEKISNE